jgi:aminodeoxyfutalosine synthase
MAGSEEQNPAMSTKELVTLIRQGGFYPIERDSLYNTITDYNEVVFDEDAEFKGYLALPVLN